LPPEEPFCTGELPVVAFPEVSAFFPHETHAISIKDAIIIARNATIRLLFFIFDPFRRHAAQKISFKVSVRH
jgi:hypothetical protein